MKNIKDIATISLQTFIDTIELTRCTLAILHLIRSCRSSNLDILLFPNDGRGVTSSDILPWRVSIDSGNNSSSQSSIIGPQMPCKPPLLSQTPASAAIFRARSVASKKSTLAAVRVAVKAPAEAPAKVQEERSYLSRRKLTNPA